jgi:hypothetical protein
MVKYVLTIAFLTLVAPVFSNTRVDVERKLVLAFKKINYWYERQKWNRKMNWETLS